MKIFKKISEIILMVIFIVYNAFHITFTIWSIIEQFTQTYPGTNMEMMVIIPYFYQLSFILPCIFEIILLCIFKGKLILANKVFFVMFIIQALLFDLFIHI